jgi:hypothetical protein
MLVSIRSSDASKRPGNAGMYVATHDPVDHKL